MIVTQDINAVREAAVELMKESLKEGDIERQIENVLLHGGAEESTLAKLMPVRTVADGFYNFATYLMWLRGMMDSGVEIVLTADEAEGLCAIEAARQEFERDHPACPQCGLRQYSRFAMSCRSSACGAKFEKKR